MRCIHSQLNKESWFVFLLNPEPMKLGVVPKEYKKSFFHARKWRVGSERAMLECSGCINILRWVLGSVFLTISWWSESLVELNVALGLLPRPVESHIPRAGFRNLYLLSSTDTCGTKPSESPWTGAKRMSSLCHVSRSVVSDSMWPHGL